MNLMAAFFSRLTILFMFWSLTLLLKRHIIGDRMDETMVLWRCDTSGIAHLPFQIVSGSMLSRQRYNTRLHHSSWPVCFI
jgi:hypothetical protein